MKKSYGFLRLFSLCMISLIVLSACGAPNFVEGSKLVCPVVYDPETSTCEVGNTNSDVNKEVVTAVYVGRYQNAVYIKRGGGYGVYSDVGYHSTPESWAHVYNIDLRTLETNIDPGECPEDVYTEECVEALDGVNLKNNVKFDASFELDYKIIVNQETTAQLLYEAGGYVKLMTEFNERLRDLFRDSKTIDSQLWVDNALTNQEVAKIWYEKLLNDPYMTEWKYYHVFDFVELRVRYFEPAKVKEDTSVNTNQENQEAEAFATQRAIACGDYTEPTYRLECERTYFCTQDGSCYFGGGVIPVQTAPPVTVTPTP